MNLIGSYKNGNYTVAIYDDGTKVRYNNEDNLTPSMPESMDVKITNQCDRGCPFCHEDSRIDGKHADIMSYSFIDNLHPYTELAIGGGNPLSHPDLEKFLRKCKNLNLIPSMTVNQVHFMQNYDFIKNLSDEKLIYGLGISLTSVNAEFISLVKSIPNAVIHVINGIVTINELKHLADNNLKILILGYKEFRRGFELYTYSKDCQFDIEHKMSALYDELPKIIKDGWFKVVSFDNLALKQLTVKRCLSDAEWNEFYMGDDGGYTFFIDMVEKKYGKSSTTPVSERKDLITDANEMFRDIQSMR